MPTPIGGIGILDMGTLAAASTPAVMGMAATGPAATVVITNRSARIAQIHRLIF
jgi:hypothetical protein